MKYDFPHSIRLTPENRATLGKLKNDFTMPISAAALGNHILRQFGIPAYNRASTKPVLRPFIRRK